MAEPSVFKSSSPQRQKWSVYIMKASPMENIILAECLGFGNRELIQELRRNLIIVKVYETQQEDVLGILKKKISEDARRPSCSLNDFLSAIRCLTRPVFCCRFQNYLVTTPFYTEGMCIYNEACKLKNCKKSDTIHFFEYKKDIRKSLSQLLKRGTMVLYEKWISQHFEFQQIRPGESKIMKPQTLCFWYSSGYSQYSLEIITNQLSSTSTFKKIQSSTQEKASYPCPQTFTVSEETTSCLENNPNKTKKSNSLTEDFRRSSMDKMLECTVVKRFKAKELEKMNVEPADKPFNVHESKKIKVESTDIPSSSQVSKKIKVESTDMPSSSQMSKKPISITQKSLKIEKQSDMEKQPDIEKQIELKKNELRKEKDEIENLRKRFKNVIEEKRKAIKRIELDLQMLRNRAVLLKIEIKKEQLQKQAEVLQAKKI